MSQDEDKRTFELHPDAVRHAHAQTRGFSLLIFHRDGTRVVTLPDEGSVVIGRDQPATIIVPEKSLSREHARFSSGKGELWVEDLQSTNGTFAGGKRVDRARLEPGDEVALGGVIVSVHRSRSAELARLGLDGDDRFRGDLEQELVRARYFKRSFALLWVRGPQLERWISAVKQLLAPVDRAALYARDTLELLLVEAGSERATAAAQAIAAVAPAITVGGVFFPEGGASADALIEAARTACHRATSRERVQLPSPSAVHVGAPSTDLAAGAAMTALLEIVDRVARSNVSALVCGETGTGKEVIAREIHRRSKRAEKPMVAVSCAAIPAQLVESTLFGHEKGAFTGASERRKGAFESADGGTLFLDEVGELPLGVQATLLRALETKRFARVGSSEEISVDVRLIAATNRDLDAMVEAGTFRSDLLYRINTVVLRIPPLRDRAGDIAPLARYFLESAAAANESKVGSIDDRALELLARYPWPGNVRELKNAIERAVVLAQGDVITTDDLPERVRTWNAEPLRLQSEETSDLEEPREGELREQVARYEAELIRVALERSGGNQTEAARALGIPRRTLVHKLRLLGARDR